MTTQTGATVGSAVANGTPDRGNPTQPRVSSGLGPVHARPETVPAVVVGPYVMQAYRQLGPTKDARVGYALLDLYGWCVMARTRDGFRLVARYDFEGWGTPYARYAARRHLDALVTAWSPARRLFDGGAGR